MNRLLLWRTCQSRLDALCQVIGHVKRFIRSSRCVRTVFWCISWSCLLFSVCWDDVCHILTRTSYTQHAWKHFNANQVCYILMCIDFPGSRSNLLRRMAALLASSMLYTRVSCLCRVVILVQVGYIFCWVVFSLPVSMMTWKVLNGSFIRGGSFCKLVHTEYIVFRVNNLF